jgi:hypothetical protein
MYRVNRTTPALFVLLTDLRVVDGRRQVATHLTPLRVRPFWSTALTRTVTFALGSG